MRQFFTLRYWLTLLALAGVALGVWSIVRDDKPLAALPVAEKPTERRVNLIALVQSTEAASTFGMKNGFTTGEIRLALDGNRTMVVKGGTEGELACPRLAEPGACVVAADLLGDAVLWFSLIPSEPRLSITLPPIAELRPDNWVLLTNGWEVQRSASVELKCDEDTASLSEFLTRFGDDSTSTFSFEKQRIVRVTCGSAVPSTSTTSTPTTSTSLDPAAPLPPPVTGEG